MSSFSSGPWTGCSEKCNETRNVLLNYDVTALMCSDINSCTVPALYYQIVLASYVDKTCDKKLVDARVTLNVEYTFKWTYGAGTESSSFFGAEARESSQVPGALNMIFIQLRMKQGMLFRAGGIITVAGLKNSSAFDSAVEFTNMRCNLLFSRCEDSIFQPFPALANFDAMKGVLADGPAFEDVQGQVLHFQFTVRNPSVEQPALQLTVSAGTEDGAWSINPIVLEQEIFSGSKPPFCSGDSFQIFNPDDQKNTIFMNVFCNYPVEIGNAVVVKGLSSLQSDSENIPIEAYDHGIESTGLWIRSAGWLRIAINRTYKVNEPVSFSFSLRNKNLNPASLDRIANIRMSMPRPSKIRQLVKMDGNPADGSEYNEYSLSAFNALSRASTFAVIRETHQISAKPNLLSCYVKAGFDLFAGDLVVLNGLTGSKMPSSDNMPLNSSSGLIIGKWDNRGVLSFYTQTRIPALDLFYFQFTIENPITQQPSPQIYISILTYRGHHFPFVPCLGIVLTSSVPRANFVSASISENSNIQNDLNQISVGFSIDAKVLPPATLSISGLNGAQTRNGVINLQQAQEYLAEIGLWMDGSLIVLIQAEIPAGEYVKFTFAVINPAAAILSTRKIVFLCPGLTENALILESNILRAELSPSWSDASVTESSAVPGAPNNISFNATSNVQISCNSTIQISGLTGSMTLSGELKVRGLGSKQVSTAYFDSTNGSITLSINGTIHSLELFSVEFTLTNPPSRQRSVALWITAHVLTESGRFFDIDRADAPQEILGASDMRSFLNMSVSESSLKTGQDNRITIFFQTNFEIFERTHITISNLVGTQSSDGSDLGVAGKFQQQSWNQSGELVLIVIDRIAPSEQVILIFSLINAKYQKNPVVPCISSDAYPDLQEPLAIVSANQTWYDGIRLWSGQQPPSESKGTILGPSDTSIWNTALIGEDSLIAGQPNKISVTLEPSITLEAQSTVTLSGLVGSMFAGTTVELQGLSSSSQFGKWAGDFGVLTFTLEKALVESEALTFDFTITNPLSRQPSVLPSVFVTDSNGSAYSTWAFPLSSNTQPLCCLSAQEAAKFITCTVRETSSVPRQLNTLYFTFLANTNLPVEALVTVSGLLGLQTPTNPSIPVLGLQTPTNPSIPVDAGSDLTGDWDQDSGTLIFSVSDKLFACPVGCEKEIQFSVCLRNSPTPRLTKLSLTVSAAYFGSYSTVLGSASIIGDILASDGEATILSSVQGSTSHPNAQNTISVTVRSNIELSVCNPIWLISSFAWIQDASGAEASCPWRNGIPCLQARLLFDGLYGTGVEISLSGSRTITFNLGEIYRVDGFRVYTNAGSSSAKRIRFQYSDSLRPNAIIWREAGVMNVWPGGMKSVLELDKPYASQYWRLILDSTYDSTGGYPYSTIQELQVRCGCGPRSVLLILLVVQL